MRNFTVCTPPLNIFRITKQISRDGRDMWYVGRGVGRELHTWFWWGNMMESDHLEDVGVHENIILKWIVKK